MESNSTNSGNSTFYLIVHCTISKPQVNLGKTNGKFLSSKIQELLKYSASHFIESYSIKKGRL